MTSSIFWRRREDPDGILVLTYNRHAAAEVRARLRHLVGNDAARVTVLTCHALAMRLVGASFASAGNEPKDFDALLREAVHLIDGEGLSRSEAEAQREALIQGYRWILVDEYQDIGPEEYALIAAVAGRSLDDPDQRLSLFAVGDDDQNIYAFTGAGFVHPPVRGRLPRQAEVPYRKLSLNTLHHRRRQPGDRTRARPDEGRTPDHRGPDAQPRARRQSDGAI